MAGPTLFERDFEAIMKAECEDLRGELLRAHRVHQVRILGQAGSTAEALRWEGVSFLFLDAEGEALGYIDVSDEEHLLQVGGYLLDIQEVPSALETVTVNWDLQSDVVSVST
jgi:hypothetical protein